MTFSQTGLGSASSSYHEISNCPKLGSDSGATWLLILSHSFFWSIRYRPWCWAPGADVLSSTVTVLVVSLWWLPNSCPRQASACIPCRIQVLELPSVLLRARWRACVSCTTVRLLQMKAGRVKLQRGLHGHLRLSQKNKTHYYNYVLI